MSATGRLRPETTRWIAAGALLVVVAGVPLIVSGPGSDLDVANIFRSGRFIASQSEYLASRPPGAPVHETIVGYADLVGGTTLVNLTSLLAAIAFVVGLDRLLAREGLGPARRWAIAIVACNPWFVVAATSAVDYVFGLAFVVWSAVLLRSGRAAWAGVLAGLAMGCRVGSVVLIVPMLFAQVTEPDDRPAAERWRPILVAGGVAAAATLLLMVPSYRASGGFDFVQNDFRTEAPLVHLGRAAVKNLAMFGIVASAVALLAIPPIVRSMRTWSTSWLLRFAVPGFVLSELLFVRFPWKVSHLLPALACGAIALAVALRDRPRLLVVLAALQLVSGVVTIQVFTPDRPNFAEGADVGFDVVAGQVVTDWRCRREYPDAYRGRQRIEVEEAWACSQPFVLEQDR